MTKFLVIVLVVALIAGFFACGGSISIENNAPKIHFDGTWEDIGRAIGNVFGKLFRGIVAGFQDSSTTTPTEAETIPPELVGPADTAPALRYCILPLHRV